MKVAWVRAGDVLQLMRRSIRIDPTRSYRPIGVKSFGKGLIEYPDTLGPELSKLRYFEVPTDCLVLSNIKAWEGAVALATATGGKLVCSNRFLTYVPRSDKVTDLSYIWNYLLSDVGIADLNRASPGSADRNRTLGISAFENLQIPLPPLKTQVSISRTISASALGADSSMAICTCDAIREQLVSGLGGDGRQLRLGDFLTADVGATRVAAEESYPNVGLLNRGRGVFMKPPLSGRETKYTHLYQIKKKQLIYSKLFGWEGAVTVVPAEFHGFYVSGEFPHFDVDGKVIHPDYLRHLTKSSALQSQLATASTGMGQRRHRVHVDRFLAIEVPLPPKDAQERIMQRLNRIENIEALAQRRDQLAAALPSAVRNDLFAKLTR